jgi:Spy/CpxP family protein refolding chaperone
MKKLVLISLAVLFVMGLAVSSDAVVKKKGTGMHAGMAACDGDCGCSGVPMEKFKALGLDEKQKEAVQAIHFRTKKEMVRSRADAQVAEIELKEILSKDPVDLKAAEAAVKKIEGVKSEMRMLHIKAMEEIKANLTPEQRKKFVSMMGMGRMGHGHDGMKGKGHKHCMGNMEEMEPMGHGQHDGGTPPMQHEHD